MKQGFVTIAIFFFFSLGAVAQDIIHTKEGSDIISKVLEINENDIIYKDYYNLEGPDYRIDKMRVISIDFENGRKELFRLPVSPLGNYSGSHYDYMDRYDRGGSMSRSDYMDYIGYSLYGSEYVKAQNKYYWGLGLTVGGAGLLVFAILVHNGTEEYNNFSQSHHSSSSGYIVFYVSGVACLGAGIPLWVSGGKRLRRIADDYHRNYVKPNIKNNVSLNLGPTQSGLGLALNF